MAERLSATKLALLGRQLWQAHGELRNAEPIAVIGMGSRFPGGVRSPSALWELLLAGADAVGEVPPERWDADALFDPDPATPGKMSSRWGGFLEGIAGFDAAFFGITPSEAERMDPQHRIALEVACDALEDAGVPLEGLRQSATGIYFSVYHNDYTLLQYGHPESVNARTLTGTLHSVLANRISYVLGLRGPSMIVDTACSSSLVGLHLACQALRSRDCDLAVVGGVNLNLSPEVTIALSKGGFMSPRGRCRTFDQGADGFVRGEACAAVVVKRLADAIADGDRIAGVVRGTAVNQDGESTTISAPNGLAQEALLRRALESAGIGPHEISLIETHGTGTELGDPIETDALAAVFRDRPEELGPCYLGSLKANVGHPEAAAGVAGLIKLLLCMQHRTIPPHPHFTGLNPHISFDSTPFVIAREATPWTAPSGRRLAGVSSFGVGGTNAHVILEEPPQGLDPTPVANVPPFLLPLSARSREGLRELCGDYARLLRDEPDRIGEICRATSRRRSHHRPFRQAVVGSSPSELVSRLSALADPGSPALSGAGPDHPPDLCFVYSGQGTQWAGMAGELADRDEGFASTLAEVAELVSERTGKSLLEEMARPSGESRLDRTDLAQSAIFAVQVALTEWLAGHGIRPALVIGHSVGEIAAAYAAGMLDLPTAVAAVADRGRAMQGGYDLGRMVSVRGSEDRIREVAAGLGVSVSAVNGPSSIVLSGPTEAIEAARLALDAQGYESKPLDVRFAFHSPLMAAAAEELRAAQAELSATGGDIPFVSTVTGEVLSGLDGDYLARNIRSPVLFRSAIETAVASGIRSFVELGPHPALGGAILETVAGIGGEARVSYALHRERDGMATLRALLGRIFEWGGDPDWSALHTGTAFPFPLPPYPWQHRDYWLPVDSGRAAPPASRHEGGQGTTGGPTSESTSFPGRRVVSPAVTRPVFELHLDDPIFRAFGDHRIGDRPRLPGTALAEFIRRAGQEVGLSGALVRDLALLHPVELGHGGSLQAILEALPGGGARCDVHVSQGPEDWTLAASGMLTPVGKVFGSDSTSLPEPVRDPSTSEGSDPAPEASSRSAEDLYDLLAGQGYEFGPGFRLLRDYRLDDGTATGELDTHALARWPGGPHPAAVDAGAHLCLALMHEEGALDPGSPLVPWALDALRVDPSLGPVVRASARRRASDHGTLSFDVTLFDAEGAPAVRLDGWQLRRSTPAADPLRVVHWAPRPLDAASLRQGGRWLLVSAPGGLASGVSEALSKGGAEVTRIEVSDLGDPEGTSLLPLFADRDEASRIGVVFVADGEGSPRGGEASTVALLNLARALVDEGPQDFRLLVVTRGSQAVGTLASGGTLPSGGAWGLARTIRAELPEVDCTLLDLDPLPGASARPGAEGASVAAEALSQTRDGEVAIRDGERLRAERGVESFRIVTPPPEPPVRLVHRSRGTLDGLVLRTDDPPAPPGPGEVLVRISAAGLNFRDVLTALGEYPGDPELGLEGSGIVLATGHGVTRVHPGDRVLVFWAGCFGSQVTAPEEFVFPAPAGMTPAHCATLPVAFGTAWYALHELGGISSGQRVLIHAGAGGVGMAAIRLAQQAGAQVFATAGAPWKRALLEASGVAGVYDSRSPSFEEAVLEATDGEGVDLVLNSLIGELIPAGLRCLRPGGLFVELGKREQLTPERLRTIRDDVRYRAFDLRDEAGVDPTLLPRAFEALRLDFEGGRLTPLPCSVLPLQEAVAGFRRMARADHVGKIVFTLPEGTHDSSTDGWAVVTGGTGGLGLATVRWLVAEGHLHIAVLTRSTPDAETATAFAELRGTGVEIRAVQADVGDEDALGEALAELRAAGPPITKVFHAAGVLDDGTLAGLTPERLRAVMRPKARGAWNLHLNTLQDPLEAFVLYSAVGPLLEGAGQGSYAAANGFLDTLATWRRGLGLPGVSVVWGPWAGAGMAAGLDERQRERWARHGLAWWDPETGANLLRSVTGSSPPPVVVAVRLDPARTARTGSGKVGDEVEGRELPGQGAAAHLTERLRSVPAHRRSAALQAHVREVVTAILGHADPVDPGRPLRDAGLDSLSAIELRNALTVSTGRTLPATLAFDHPTVEAISAFLGGLLPEFLDGAAQPSGSTSEEEADAPEASAIDSAGARTGSRTGSRTAPEPERAVHDYAELSDEEAEALLLRELQELRSERGEDR